MKKVEGGEAGAECGVSWLYVVCMKEEVPVCAWVCMCASVCGSGRQVR